MAKPAAILFIAMIAMAMSVGPVMGCGSHKCGPSGGGSSGTPSTGRCPLNALKLGACVDVLNGLAHVQLGDPVVNQCCPLLQGIVELEAALCFCTTIRAKVLNLNIVLPVALELFVQCGLTPPPGFKCPPLN
ncbi:hypothetical protein SUGI_0492190 [Cryptomeria japonica]|nr:hypothetical protein SUGI_0492190 [Cryptomeria japonica]